MRLLEIQQALARAILADGPQPRHLNGLFAEGPVPWEEALRVHRNTALGAGAHALRLGFPTVARLLGEDIFDAAAVAFVKRAPAHSACLDAYGDGFAAFLAAHAPAGGPPFLADVARLDQAVGRAARAPAGERSIAIDAAVTVMLPASLAVLWLDWPADRIRDALDADDGAALARIGPAPRSLLVWRKGPDAAVRAVSAPAAAFAGALMAGTRADAALAAATFHAGTRTALEAIQSEIFAASFCRILADPAGPQRRARNA